MTLTRFKLSAACGAMGKMCMCSACAKMRIGSFYMGVVRRLP